MKDLTVKRVDLVDVGANYDKESGEGSHVVFFKREDLELAKKKKHLLKNLQLSAVAFVDKGANPEADILLFKRADGTAMSRPELGAVIEKHAFELYPELTREAASAKLLAELPEAHAAYETAPKTTAPTRFTRADELFAKRDEFNRPMGENGKRMESTEAFARIEALAMAKCPDLSKAEAITRTVSEDPGLYEIYKGARPVAVKAKEVREPSKLELFAQSPTARSMIANVERIKKRKGDSLADFATAKLLEMADRRAQTDKLSPEVALLTLLMESSEAPGKPESQTIWFLFSISAEPRNSFMSVEDAFTLDSIRTDFEAHGIAIAA